LGDAIPLPARKLTSDHAGNDSIHATTAGRNLRIDKTTMATNTTLDEAATAHTMYRFLGAHLTQQDGVDGVRFAVWAPNAHAVSVICDGNGWTPGRDRLTGSDSGHWTGFVPNMPVGSHYKYAIETPHGDILQKADPVAFRTELRPATASIVHDLKQYDWNDDAWLQKRSQLDPLHSPMSTYEVHLGSWKRPDDGREFFNYRELAHQIAEYAKGLGYTHIQLMPVTEHPFDGSWGYQTTGYFAPSSRFGTPEDFMYFVDHCHQNDLSILIDWVPAHFPTDAHGLGNFDGTHLYEHADPRQGFHPDWNTLIFNYGRDEVCNFLLSSARFWADLYHIDGIRVDAVASMLYLDYSREAGEWLPNKDGGRENLEAIEFLKQFNMMMHGDFPGVVTVAEESTAWPGVSRPVYTGGLGFTMKWDMGWMNDTLKYMQRDPAHRKWHQDDLSFRMVYAWDENFVLPLSHDEVVHGKKSLLSQMPGDNWQKFANLRLLYSMQYAMPGKQLLFMGCEFGQWLEWNHDTQIDWPLLDSENHAGLHRMIGDLNRVCTSDPAFYTGDFEPAGFRWIQCDDSENSVFAWMRMSTTCNSTVVCVANFTPIPRHDYRIGVPNDGDYREILNTDAEIYSGTNVGNLGVVKATEVAAHGFAQSLEIQLPPLAFVMLKLENA
jgi:1,4-alpha-glucan branching enzyme